MRLRDRKDAGRQLAGALAHLKGEDVIVLALPRGGVPVGLELARALDAPLDVIGVRKIGAPSQPEFGIGAVAEDGVRVVDERSASMLGLGDAEIEPVAAREREEVRRRVARYRGDRELPDLEGRTVIVVDDGLATGVTARAALRAVRGRGASRVVLAVPVGAPRTVESMQDEADDVVCLHAPPSFRAVGTFYERFDQTTDDEVLAALREAGTPRPGAGG